MSASNPFAPGATIGEKRVERWRPAEVSGLNPKRLDFPLRWRGERFVVVNCDLFHESLSDEAIAAVFGVMAPTPWHTFQVLTKRPERMLDWFDWIKKNSPRLTARLVAAGANWPRTDTYSAESVLASYFAAKELGEEVMAAAPWPLPNVWLGVSVEDQATADERIPLLLQTPAAKRFVSYEPALGPVDFENLPTPRGTYWHGFAGTYNAPSGRFALAVGDEVEESRHARLVGEETRLDWIIVGGESGPGARPFDIAWARSTVEQGKATGVAVFVKQLGSKPFAVEGSAAADLWSPNGRDGVGLMDDCGFVHLRDRKGGDWDEWPEDIRVREFPV